MMANKSFRNLIKRRTKYIIIVVILVAVTNYFGILDHFFERNYYKDFDYPLDVDIVPLIDQLKNNIIPLVPPVNMYNYTFSKACEEKCKDLTSLGLVIIVKSAMGNFERRQAIRNTYGDENRFPNLVIRTVFLLGIKDFTSDLQISIDKENQNYGDIVQANFIDTYFNNTIKTMMGLTWVSKYCSNSKFYYFSDDDMYVSTKNLIYFIKDSSNYPEYIEKYTQKQDLRKWDIKIDDLPDNLLYSGFVYNNSPYRNKNSKWYVSLDEYSWHMWPPYIPAGAFILSNKALMTIYYGSFYTKHFRFDDIYLAIVAKKCGITPFYCKEIHISKKYYHAHDYRYVVASHGYSDSLELINVWNEQKSLGYA